MPACCSWRAKRAGHWWNTPGRPPPFARYVSTWRTRYAIDGAEVDIEDVKARIEGLEVVEVRLGGDGWQIRWLLFKTTTPKAEKTKP